MFGLPKFSIPRTYLGLIAVFALCTALFTIGCSSNGTDNQFSMILSGTVVDKVSGDPLSGAWVSLRDSTGVDATTAADGTWEIEEFNMNEVIIFARKAGYLTTIDTIITNGNDVSGIVLKLEAGE